MKILMQVPGQQAVRLTRDAFTWLLGYTLIGIALIALSAPSVSYLLREAHIAACYMPLVDTR